MANYNTETKQLENAEIERVEPGWAKKTINKIIWGDSELNPEKENDGRQNT